MGKFFKIAENYPMDVESIPGPIVVTKRMVKKVPVVGEGWADQITPTPGVGAFIERILPFGKSGRHFSAPPTEVMKKTPGNKGIIQRLLPGGKTGFQVYEKEKTAQQNLPPNGIEGAPTSRYNTNRPIKSPSAPSIPNAKVPNIRPTAVKDTDLLTARTESALGSKTAMLKEAISVKALKRARRKTAVKNIKSDWARAWHRLRTRSPDTEASTRAWARLSKAERDYVNSYRQYDVFAKAIAKKKKLK